MFEDTPTSVDVKSREIYLFGDSDNEIEHNSAYIFLKSLRELEEINTQPIMIHANTVGGCWYDGLSMFDAIKNSPCYITYVIHGQALSMGSIIPQAADLRVMMPHAVMMIHHGTPGLSADLNAKQAEESLNVEKHNTNIMLEIYVDRCIESQFFTDYTRARVKSFIKKKMDNKHDWWLQPEEALEHGFIDQILGDKYKSLKELRSKQ